jgi:sterol desaturase/sphingolipid hydroxylase (fatty acid hydroxylase superfamily)
MFDWLTNFAGEQFAALHGRVFETGVLPVVHALGLGGYAEQAFNGTEFFLIGAIEITILAVVLGALEKCHPAETQNDESAKRVDVIYTMLHRLGFVPLLMFLLLVPLVDAIDGALRMVDIIPWKPEDAFPVLNESPWLSFFLYLVILDFVAYWLHRAQHRSDLWWALHSLHHSQRQMSFWSDDRNHLLDDFAMDGAFALVALLIGVAPAQFVLIVVATRVVESLSHANLKLSFGRIGKYLLVSPQFHRMHHGIGVGHEGLSRGCNFAVLFPVWDVIFRTANFENNYPSTGVRDQLDGADYGRGFWAQQWLGLQRLTHVHGT